MTHTITVTQRTHDSLRNAKLGDTFTITATAIITELASQIIDVTPMGSPPESDFLPGETTIELLLTKVEIA